MRQTFYIALMPKTPALPTSYNAVAKTLHWLIAFAIILMLILGWTMTNVAKDNPNRFMMFQLHKSIGITILLLSLYRLYWRLTHTVPPLPATMKPWEKFTAQTAHVLFYVFIIGMPLIGWAIISTSTLPTYFFGLFPWPHLPVLPTLENKKEIGNLFGELHELGAFVLVALIVLHIAAAHKHHWIDRDDILTRMAPGPIARLLNRMRGIK